MKAVRLLFFSLRRVTTSPSPSVALFSSSSPLITKSMNFVATKANERCFVKQNRPKFTWKSSNFFGTVEQPLNVHMKDGRIVIAWTILRAKVSPDSNYSFRMRLNLWEKMAESWIERLKPNDYIYVAGALASYTRAEKFGMPCLSYQLNVSELKCIAHNDQCSKSQNSVGMLHEGGHACRGSYGERLYLWQVFFSSPREWWDKRNKKSNPNQPDFVHKSTGEALWLRRTDPPWITKQLKLVDTKMKKKDHDGHFFSDSSIPIDLYT